MIRYPVAVIGPGRVGAPLGSRLGRAGWPIIYGVRDPTRQSLQDLVIRSGSEAELTTPTEAAQRSRIILFSVPWSAAKAALSALGNLDDKILIDTTNPFKYENGVELEVDVPESTARLIQDWSPKAFVVKAFNTLNFRIMADPSLVDGEVTIPVAGDALEAKTEVRRLVEDLGFGYTDVGPLRNAHYLEKMAALYVSMFFQDRPDAFEYHLQPRKNNQYLPPGRS